MKYEHQNPSTRFDILGIFCPRYPVYPFSVISSLPKKSILTPLHQKPGFSFILSHLYNMVAFRKIKHLARYSLSQDCLFVRYSLSQDFSFPFSILRNAIFCEMQHLAKCYILRKGNNTNGTMCTIIYLIVIVNL